MIKRDLTLVATVLFTISLLALVPHNLQYASTWDQQFLPVAGALVQNYLMPLGFASLAIVAVGMIVLWIGFVGRHRWAWGVMCILVWVFAFPVYIIPELLNIRGQSSIDWVGFIRNAVAEPGIDRAVAKSLFNFLLMNVALFLPITKFFGGRNIDARHSQ